MLCQDDAPGNLAMRPPETANLVEFTARVYSRRLGHFKLSYCGLASLRLRIPHDCYEQDPNILAL